MAESKDAAMDELDAALNAMGPDEFAKLMIMAKAFTSADGTMELEAFTDASAHILQARRPPRARPSAPPSARSRLTLERWL